MMERIAAQGYSLDPPRPAAAAPPLRGPGPPCLSANGAERSLSAGALARAHGGPGSVEVPQLQEEFRVAHAASVVTKI